MTPLPGNEGDHTGVRCPRSGCGGEVIYNGNYFCEYWTWRGLNGRRRLERWECDWALGPTDDDLLDEGEVVTAEDRVVWIELRQRYQPLREYLARHPEEDRS